MTDEKSPADRLEAVRPASVDSLILLPVILPDKVEVPKSSVKPAPVAPLVKVPTEVNDEAVTPEARVAPVRVPAGATTAFPEAAVIKPLPLTVKVGIEVEEPKDPTLVFTVAKVVANDPAEVVMSPVKAGNLPAARVPVAFVPDRSTALTVMA